ncbi:MAG: septum formation initiator family protein [Clostridia bacterium]|nr:septum formation initiator family protein [Clostridia bacterium]
MRKIFNLRNLIFVALAAGLIALIVSQQSILDRNIEKNASLKESIQQVEEQISELEKEKSMMGTDEYIEDKAREKLGYVKSDETVFMKNE